jgi:hypothetical protein
MKASGFANPPHAPLHIPAAAPPLTLMAHFNALVITISSVWDGAGAAVACLLLVPYVDRAASARVFIMIPDIAIAAAANMIVFLFMVFSFLLVRISNKKVGEFSRILS